MSMLRSTSLAALGTLLACGSAFAADFTERFEGKKPAVSALNGKIEAAYTWIDPDVAGVDLDLWHGAGALSIPLGQQFGLQIDGGIGRLDTPAGDATVYGVGGHLFWRDPDVALLGVYSDVLAIDPNGPRATIWRYGVEGELYLGQFSVEAFIGGDSISSPGLDETYFSADALAAFYFTDNFRVHAGIGHRFDETYARVGAEAALPFAGNNFALFADGAFNGDFTSIKGGLRVYFGESGKSLKGRHREDDPRIRLFDISPVGGFGGGGGAGAPGGGGEEGGGDEGGGDEGGEVAE